MQSPPHSALTKSWLCLWPLLCHPSCVLQFSHRIPICNTKIMLFLSALWGFYNTMFMRRTELPAVQNCQTQTFADLGKRSPNTEPQITPREKMQLFSFYYKVNNLRIFSLTVLKPSFICPWAELEAARFARQPLFVNWFSDAMGCEALTVPVRQTRCSSVCYPSVKVRLM